MITTSICHVAYRHVVIPLQSPRLCVIFFFGDPLAGSVRDGLCGHREARTETIRGITVSLSCFFATVIADWHSQELQHLTLYST